MGTGILVGRLSLGTSEHDFFAGDRRSVLSATVVTDRANGRSRGFVELGTGTDMTATVSAFHGKPLHRQQLRVSEAHERAERPQRFNRPRSGGFGRPCAVLRSRAVRTGGRI